MSPKPVIFRSQPLLHLPHADLCCSAPPGIIAWIALVQRRIVGGYCVDCRSSEKQQDTVNRCSAMPECADVTWIDYYHCPTRMSVPSGSEEIEGCPLSSFAQVKVSCRFCGLAERPCYSAPPPPPRLGPGVFLGEGQVFLLALTRESLRGQRARMKNPELIPRKAGDS